jgi:hypothetical protein
MVAVDWRLVSSFFNCVILEGEKEMEAILIQIVIAILTAAISGGSCPG